MNAYLIRIIKSNNLSNNLKKKNVRNNKKLKLRIIICSIFLFFRLINTSACAYNRMIKMYIYIIVKNKTCIFRKFAAALFLLFDYYEQLNF